MRSTGDGGTFEMSRRRRYSQRNLSDKEALEARKKFISAYSVTLVAIWKEKIARLKVFDTWFLFHHVLDLPDIVNDSEYSDFTLSQAFPVYGFYQNWGVGREMPAGKRLTVKPKRLARRWFDRKYFASVLRLRDFFADNLGERFAAMIPEALSDAALKQSLRNGSRVL